MPIDKDAVIAAMRETGATLVSVAARFGTSKQRIFQIVGPKYERNLPIEQARKMFEEGSPLREIMAKTKLSRSWLSRNGVLSIRKERVPRHGTAAEYKNHGCRCELCKTANKVMAKSSTEKRRTKAAADPSIVPHGTINGYTNYACRCPDCLRVGRESQRKKPIASASGVDPNPSDGHLAGADAADLRAGE